MKQNKIIVAIGGNIFSRKGLHPVEIGEQAIKLMKSMSIFIEKQSSWYRTGPIPKSNQPKFFNSVIVARTSLNKFDVLSSLHRIENNFGRVRKNINEARIIDLDLIDYSSKIFKNKTLIIPHPRSHLRRFVMEPLAEVEKNWIHPVLKISAKQILNQLDAQDIELFSKSK